MMLQLTFQNVSRHQVTISDTLELLWLDRVGDTADVTELTLKNIYWNNSKTFEKHVCAIYFHQLNYYIEAVGHYSHCVIACVCVFAL